LWLAATQGNPAQPADTAVQIVDEQVLADDADRRHRPSAGGTITASVRSGRRNDTATTRERGASR
jgi:hypothetical protein